MNSRVLTLATVIMALGLLLITCKKDEPQPVQVIAPKPLITSFAPISGNPNTAVTITGKNFKNDPASNAIKFNGIAAIVQSATSDQLITAVPVGAASGKITVTVDGVTITSEKDFTVIEIIQPQLSINSLIPSWGYKDTQVTITGTNFKEDLVSNTVKFNGITAVVKLATPTLLITAVPTGATSGKLTVTVDGITATSATDFTVLIPETITSFTPTSGPAGTTVTITGTNFSSTIADNVVLFNGKEAQIISATSTTLVVTVPAGATTGRISVTINGVDAISSYDFIIQ